MGFHLANIAGRAALVLGAEFFDLEEVSDGEFGPDLMAALMKPDEMASLLFRLGGKTPGGVIADVDLGPPVPSPQKVFGVGLNYEMHVQEGGMETPSTPVVFTKFPSCLVGPNADVEIRSDFCDYEGELVVVIGTGGKDIPKADAWEHVLGLMVGQDISDRMVQYSANPPHFDLGKSFDTFGPIGPTLVSVDEVINPDDLRIVTAVNGEIRQDSSTKEMIFDVPTLISYLSGITTLTTGDIIFTGTPDGIGAAQGKFLSDGDIITTTIEGVGTMTNRCVRVSDFQGVDQ